MRVNVNLSDEMVKKVDGFAKAYGVPRSALLSIWIGQTVDGLTKVEDVYKKAGEALAVEQKK